MGSHEGQAIRPRLQGSSMVETGVSAKWIL